MTEGSALPLFRLRAFELDWVQPLLAEAEGSPLNRYLLAESAAWIAGGQAIEYFAEAAPLFEIPAWAPERELVEQPELPPLDPDDFEFLLVMAQEDLTPARRAYLETVLFADEPEWEKRLSVLDDLPDRLSRDPAGGPLESYLLGRASWATKGSDSCIPSLGVAQPAAWRTDGSAVMAWLWPHTVQRRREVNVGLMKLEWALAASEVRSGGRSETEVGPGARIVTAQAESEPLTFYQPSQERARSFLLAPVEQLGLDEPATAALRRSEISSLADLVARVAQSIAVDPATAMLALEALRARRGEGIGVFPWLEWFKDA